MQADMRVLRTEHGFRLDTEDVAADAVLRHLSLYKVGRDVNVEEVTDTESILSLIGPASSEIALSGPLGPEHAQSKGRLDGVSFLAVATEDGIDLIVAGDEAATLSSAVLARGAEAVSEEAAEIVRVEAGRPRFGREMTTATIPQEAGINDRAVSFSKGCYIGQETVARLHYKGKPNRHLRGLRLSGPARDGRSGPPRRARPWARRHRRDLPRPRSDRAGDPAPRGRARRGRQRRRRRRALKSSSSRSDRRRPGAAPIGAFTATVRLGCAEHEREEQAHLAFWGACGGAVACILRRG